MKRCWPFLALLGLALGMPFFPSARAEGPWTRISTQDGLLQRSIHCLSPTASGGMLVGTSGGLSYWDGRRWVSYGPGNGLPEGEITAAVEGRGTIWAGSWGGGLGCLQDGRWKRYLAADSPLPGDWISDLALDGEGLWIATYGRGLAYLEGGQWTLFARASSALPTDWLTCLLPDGAGGIWIGTERAGLAHLDSAGRWRTYTLPAPELADEVTDLAWQSRQLWVGTRWGVAVLDPQSESWHVLGPDQGLPGRHITALAALPDGRMGVGTDQGLALWDEGKVETFTVREGLPHQHISALAVDARGRAWVGSYVRGLAVDGELTAPPVARPPVILVHGWRGPGSDLLEDSEFWHLARWLREDGFEPYYATGISPEKSLHANAARLREVIARARREGGAAGVYVIAFSMGGLNARAYLESTLYQGDVLRAFILGTPHRGEEMWLPFLLWEYLAWTNEPSALELFPAQAELFSRSHGNAWSVPYTIIAGDATTGDLPTLFRELVPSDGLVSTWSALGLEGPTVDRRVTGDIHAWGEETILLDIPSLLLPRSTYDAHIRPYLFGAADAPGTGSPVSSLGYTRPVLEPRSALRTGSLAPGETVILDPIPIDAVGRARFYVRWKGEPLEVSLRDPQGRLIDPDEAEEDDGSEYLELDFADFAGYVLTDTLPGPWSIILSADPKNAASSQYVAYASLASPLRLEVCTNRPWYRPGEQITISATLAAAGTGAVLNEAQVDIYSPDKKPTTLHLMIRAQDAELVAVPPWAEAAGLLMRSRLKPAERPFEPVSTGFASLARCFSAGRGARRVYQPMHESVSPALTDTLGGTEPTYVGSFRAPAEGGFYLGLVRALGQRGEQPLERGAEVTFGVYGDGARLSGAYTLELDQAEGKAKGLKATIAVSVKREGEYLCSVTLVDRFGQRVTTVAHPEHLGPGEHSITLPLPGQAIADSEQEGPYHLGEVILADVSGAAVLLDVAEDVGPSAPAQPQDFIGA